MLPSEKKTDRQIEILVNFGITMNGVHVFMCIQWLGDPTLDELDHYFRTEYMPGTMEGIKFSLIDLLENNFIEMKDGDKFVLSEFMKKIQ